MKRYIIYFIALFLSSVLTVGCASGIDQPTTIIEAESRLQAETTYVNTEAEISVNMSTNSTEEISNTNHTSILSSVNDLMLREIDDQEQTYTFLYDGEAYQAIYTTDNWKIIDSYQITNAEDIVIICQALADLHMIHGADMESYRTAEDMAYEWIQHNLAYQLLPANSPWKQSVKDVDIDPADQGKNVYDFYRERVGDFGLSYRSTN